MTDLIINCDRAMLFKRPDSPFWQARIVVNGVMHRRSTYRRRKRDAKIVMNSWRLQLIRRGKPVTGPQCLADL